MIDTLASPSEPGSHQYRGSPLFLPALVSCPFLTDLALNTTPCDYHLPQLEADVLALLNSYHGPHIYAPFFAQGRALIRVEFTPSCQPDDILSTIITLSPNPVCIHSFTCNVQHPGVTFLRAIRAAFPSLMHLTHFQRSRGNIHLGRGLATFGECGAEEERAAEYTALCTDGTTAADVEVDDYCGKDVFGATCGGVSGGEARANWSRWWYGDARYTHLWM